MTSIRSDAARSRARILEVARAQPVDELRLNEIARRAGVGVATVYRHFPTVHRLVEALTAGTIERILELSRRAAADPDPGAACASYLRAVLLLQLENEGLQAILVASDDESPEVTAAKEEIFASASIVLERAKDAGAVRADLTFDQLQHLVCGIEHAVRLGVPEDRAAFLDVLLSGIRPSTG